MAHSIDCALGSGVFDRVIVSTDDEEIAEVARAFGAEVPFRRPAELSDDHTATTAVIAHAVRWLQDEARVRLSAVCCIYATAPFIRATDLKDGLTTLQGGQWQYVFSATTFGFPIFRSFARNEQGGVKMFYPEHFATRSQDLPEAWHDAGQFYWGVPDAWLAQTRFFEPTSSVVAIPRWRVQDIDSPEDWHRAEILWKLLQTTAEA